MLLRSLLLTFLSFLPVVLSGAEEARRIVRQPILEYRLAGPGQSLAHSPEGRLELNGFLAFTHIGTDFGFQGPGERFIQWQDRRICMALREREEWVGMWHSLAGMADASREVMDFQGCYPAFIKAAGQPQVRGLKVKVMGSGQLKLEVKSPEQELLWSQVLQVQQADARPVELPVDRAKARRAKFLNWTAEPGADVCLTSLNLEVEAPPTDFATYVLLSSYAKLARCFTPETGWVKDRAHLHEGAFDNVPSTGLFALATAAMSQPEVGMVEPAFAQATLRQIHAVVSAVPRGRGLLPHFVRRDQGIVRIHPGTEFSTVDSAIYYHAMLLAARMLGDEATTTALLQAIRGIDFKGLRLNGQVISHGVKDDGQTVLEHGWADWGGETALVILLEQLAAPALPTPAMEKTGKAWQGSGFITELQSLFFPDFDSQVRDALSQTNWWQTRQSMLQAQKDYFRKQQPASQAARLGFYSLSAGEGRAGVSYFVGGVDLPDQHLLHPHYLLMSASLEPETSQLYALLQRMEETGYLTPWGLVENFTADGASYLPAIISLNAGFEALGAYHLLAKHRKQANAIYSAAREHPELRQAMKIFYPSGVAAR